VKRRLYSCLAIGLLLAVWQLSVVLFKLPDYALPSPCAVARGLFELASSGTLLKAVVASLFRVTWGYYLAAAAAIPLGMLMALSRPFAQALNPLIQFLRPISPLAWIPLSLIWFGIGDRPAIFLIFLSCFFPMVVFTMSGVMSIRPTFLRVADNFALTRFEKYLKIILPAALPEIVTGLRITLGTAWLVIVAAEMIAVKSGLGYIIIDARNSLRMDYVVAAMIVIGAIGIGLDTLMRRLERLPQVVWKQRER